MTDDNIATGPFGDEGSRLDKLTEGMAEGVTCRHHRLHIPFLHCNREAGYLLTKSHGERVPLCPGHAAELLARYDVPDGESPRLADGLNLGWRHPEADDDEQDETALPVSLWPSADPAPTTGTFEDQAFSAGASGGAGAGAAFDMPSDAAQADTTAAPDIPDLGAVSPNELAAPEPVESAPDTTGGDQ